MEGTGMRRQRIHHIVTILAILPLLFAVVACLSEEPQLFNPWNSLGMFFGGMWVLCLPALLASTVCLGNAVVGLVGTIRPCSARQTPCSEAMPEHA
jgi:hypothetical protein